MTIDVPAIDKTLGFGEVGIPAPLTTCPTLIPTLLATVIVEELLAHVEAVGEVKSPYIQVLPEPLSAKFIAVPPDVAANLKVLVVLSLTK